MTFYDLLEENLNDKEQLSIILLEFDRVLKDLHNRGFFIYDFNPKKIILDNGKLSDYSFRFVYNLGVNYNYKKVNVWQLSKIGIMAFNNYIVDGSLTDEYCNYLIASLKQINENGNIPEEIYEYYEEIILNDHFSYMNDYLVKRQELKGQQNGIVMKKSLSTPPGRAFANVEDAAYVNILLIPTILALVYLVGLMIYIFVLK